MNHAQLVQNPKSGVSQTPRIHPILLQLLPLIKAIATETLLYPLLPSSRMLHACTRCRRWGVEYPGYTRQLKFYNETPNTVAFQHARPSSASHTSNAISRRPHKTSMDEALAPNLTAAALSLQGKDVFTRVVKATFPGTYATFGPRCEPSWTDFIWSHPAARSPAVIWCQRCINTWFLLQDLGRLLGNPAMVASDTVLTTAVMLGVYEMFDGLGPTPKGKGSRLGAIVERAFNETVLCPGYFQRTGRDDPSSRHALVLELRHSVDRLRDLQRQLGTLPADQDQEEPMRRGMDTIIRGPIPLDFVHRIDRRPTLPFLRGLCRPSAASRSWNTTVTAKKAKKRPHNHLRGLDRSTGHVDGGTLAIKTAGIDVTDGEGESENLESFEGQNHLKAEMVELVRPHPEGLGQEPAGTDRNVTNPNHGSLKFQNAMQSPRNSAPLEVLQGLRGPSLALESPPWLSLGIAALVEAWREGGQ
ncbi:uncharacterized protein KD926_006428 [Aspergillus affinis]|uniref:uncharacterized protein n=1 Tax=Aspergillus affinis TaxID=1070780 RepID=UPI0022FDE221|nr:uncharacterized protein KD926_006428 [Aspergillus affinis]KAI9041882.1 hypothetical protein KD926_006428 [Aspergillus affinis]